ncbi:MAG: CocE/NonD family hydrolase [Aureispira sp.]|nr:CocE/NonD family hydrolase [Aureispira sp.]
MTLKKLWQGSLLLLLAFAISSFINPNNDHTKNPPKNKAKVSQLGKYQGYSKKDYKGFTYSSQYVKMPDDVKLAVDIFLPKKREAKENFPTIIYYVRYARSIQLKKGVRFLGKPYFGHVPKKEIDFFTSNGYACAIVDLRGSGASYGHRKMEFSPEEVNDMGNIIDWLTSQSWSDKQVATTGISYTGTTAEFALTTKNPAIKACIPRSAIFDLFADINFPGGIRQSPFIEVWKKTTVALDNNNFKVFGGLAGSLVKGISPVQEDKDRTMLKEAVEEHKQNFDIFAGLYRVEARDQVDVEAKQSNDDFSIHARIKEIEASKVPIYRISGWYDGGNVNSAFKGFNNVSNTEKLLIGPWDHGPHDHVSPFAKSPKVQFDVYLEMLRFFDYHMKGIQNGINEEAPIHYYQMGDEKFRSTQTWPIAKAKAQKHFFSSDNFLYTTQKDAKNGSIEYTCNYELGTGGGSRWNSLTELYRYEKHTHYDDRKEINEKMVLFSGPVLEEAMEITGHPILDLYFSADAKDATVFVYLEDVAPNGKVTYITEGQFRAQHRKISTDTPPYKHCEPYHSFKKEDMQDLTPGEVTNLSFGLLPTSYKIPKGHQLRVSLSTSDIDHFDNFEERPTKLNIYCSTEHPSSIDIPVVK